MSKPSLTVAEFRALVKPRVNKYKTAPKADRVYGGRVWASALECRYAQTLDVWKMAGAVESWRSQIPFILHAGGKKIGKHVVDFHVIYADGHDEWVETKGADLELGKFKRQLTEAEYGIKIHVVTKLPNV